MNLGIRIDCRLVLPVFILLAACLCLGHGEAQAQWTCVTRPLSNPCAGSCPPASPWCTTIKRGTSFMGCGCANSQQPDDEIDIKKLKYYKACTFSPNSTVLSVYSVDPGAISILDVAPQTDANGCLIFAAQCDNDDCEADVFIVVQGPLGDERRVLAFVSSSYCELTWDDAEGSWTMDINFPTDPACIPDICVAGGDSVGDPLDITPCLSFIPNFSEVPTVSEWGIIIMTILLLTAATIVFGRRRPLATT